MNPRSNLFIPVFLSQLKLAKFKLTSGDNVDEVIAGLTAPHRVSAVSPQSDVFLPISLAFVCLRPVRGADGDQVEEEGNHKEQGSYLWKQATPFVNRSHRQETTRKSAATTVTTPKSVHIYLKPQKAYTTPTEFSDLV